MLTNASNYICSSSDGADPWLYLDELTHRTLNDYSIMLAMIRRASSRFGGAGGLAVLADIATRLEAGAAAFGALRPSKATPSRNLDEDLEQLCASLSASRLADRCIGLTLSAEPIVLDSHRSWQVCLIVSELITNAAKHAFGTLTGGTIIVDVSSDQGALTCIVMDNGNASPNAAPGRGSRIVDALAADLRGSITRSYSRNGATICLGVPLE